MARGRNRRRAGAEPRERDPARGPIVRLGLAVAIGLTVLAGCGSNGTSPTPTATAQSAPGPVTASPGPAPTVGALADRIGVAWKGVRSFRALSTMRPATRAPSGSPRAAATAPGAGSGALEVIDEVVVPDRKRRLIRLGGVEQARYVGVGGKVYARGGLTGPGTPPTADWVVVDPKTVDPSHPAAGLYADLAAPVAAPYSALSANERARDATPLGTVTAGGRTCQAYRIVDTTRTGERVEVVLALGSDDLPCSIETRAGGTDNLTTYEYNVPLTIEAPVAVPPPGTAMP